jgi:hypothetical protein
MTWQDVLPAGAFVVGIIVGGVGVIRVTRYTMDYLRRGDHRDSSSKQPGGPGRDR